MKKEQIEHWEKDLKCYDKDNTEVNSILKLTNFRNKKVLDVGCGIARLTLPISGYAKEVVAIDVDKDIIRYCRLKKNRENIRYILSDITNFKENEFDIALFAQPDYNNIHKKIRAIYVNLNKRGRLIVVKWIDKGNEYNALLTPFWEKDKKLMAKVRKFSNIFMKATKKYFILKKAKLIKTYYSYSNKELLINSIINDSPKPLTIKDKTILNKLLSKYNYKKLKIIMRIYLFEKR